MTILIIQKDCSQRGRTLQLLLQCTVLLPLHFQRPLPHPIVLLLQPILRPNERSQEPGWGREGTLRTFAMIIECQFIVLYWFFCHKNHASFGALKRRQLL